MTDFGVNPTPIAQDSLSRRQRRAIPHLVAASTVEAGLKLAGISKGTLTNWRRHPSFLDALNAAEAIATREALSNMQRLMLRASETLAGLLDSKRYSKGDWLRHRVAVDVLAHGMKAREQLDLEYRLAELEKWQAEKNGGSKPRSMVSA